MNSEQPLLTIFNRHAASCGEPPHETNQDSSRYVGYFQNEVGDQWIFQYDPGTGSATLRSGDAHWSTVYTIRGPEDLHFTMNEAERAWALACWQSASRLMPT